MNIEVDFSKLSIAITTNGRPESLKACLLSLMSNIKDKCCIYVLDSTPEDTEQEVILEYEKIYDEFPSIFSLKYENNVSPGEARKILTQHINTEYALFLDDDLEIEKDSIHKMFSALIEESYDIISGIWLENDSKRCAGFLYTYLTRNKCKKVLKCAISTKTIPTDAVVQLDDVQCSMLVRMEIFKLVQFDGRYDFFYECKKYNIKVGVHTGAFFYHNPKPYLSKSMRYYQDKATDCMRFTQKWGVCPEFARY